MQPQGNHCATESDLSFVHFLFLSKELFSIIYIIRKVSYHILHIDNSYTLLSLLNQLHEPVIYQQLF